MIEGSVGFDRGLRGATAWRAVGNDMLGIDDPVVSLAYLLCIGSSLLCIVYGLVNWNRGEEKTEPADAEWAAHEDQQADPDQ